MLLSLIGLAALPSGYVIQRPGQVFNVMAEIDGEKVISSDDLPTYESESRFDVTTISLLGNRESNPNWVQVLFAWADPDQIVLPLDEVYPPTKTTAEVRAESTAQMEISQQDAIAAALGQLGYEVPRRLYVSSVIEDTPASKLLIAGDFIVSAGGKKLDVFEQLKAAIQAAGETPLLIEVVRDGKPVEVTITPKARDDGFFIGAMVGYTYEFPKKIKLQLGEVGGPSGGLMFTLGIIDSLTPGSLAGANHVAGTGTISADGAVGPIGGVRLKAVAAKAAGAKLFLVPEGNCSELLGKVPEGLAAVSVRNLSEALIALEVFTTGAKAPPLTCNEN